MTSILNIGQNQLISMKKIEPVSVNRQVLIVMVELEISSFGIIELVMPPVITIHVRFDRRYYMISENRISNIQWRNPLVRICGEIGLVLKGVVDSRIVFNYVLDEFDLPN